MYLLFTKMPTGMEMRTYLSLLGLPGCLGTQAEDDGAALLVPGVFGLAAFPDVKLAANFRVNRGDVSLSMASSDAELFTFIIPERSLSHDRLERAWCDSSSTAEIDMLLKLQSTRPLSGMRIISQRMTPRWASYRRSSTAALPVLQVH